MIRSRALLFFILIQATTFDFSAYAQKVKLVSSSLILSSPPFKNCHASSLQEVSPGRIMSVWFAGEYEGHAEVKIYSSLWSEGKWSAPRVVADGRASNGKGYPCWNPVLFKTASGTLFLFYKVGPNPREWWGEMKWSLNNGKTWSNAEKLSDGFLGPVRNKPLQLKSGNILYPSSTESADEKRWNIHLEISDSSATSWRKVIIDNGNFGVIQPSILRHGKDTLQMLCRSRQNAIVQTWSYDAGESWTPLSKINVLNPNSGIDALTLQSGLHLLVYNPAVAGKEWMNGRNELRLASSTDGTNWKDIYILEKEEKGEFSYPCIIQSSNGDVHVSYTFDRINLKHFIFSID